MSLFHFGKKEEEKKAPACCCSQSAPPASGAPCCGGAAGEVRSVKVLGSGCKSCHALLEAAKEAVRDMGLDVEVEYVTDMEKIMAYGAMSMPALVVNEQVVSMGRVLKRADVEALLRKPES